MDLSGRLQVACAAPYPVAKVALQANCSLPAQLVTASSKVMGHHLPPEQPSHVFSQDGTKQKPSRNSHRKLN